MWIRKNVGSYGRPRPALLAMVPALGLALAGASSAQNVRGGDAFPGQISLGDLPSGATITIEFEVVVDAGVPPGTTELCNQGTIRGANFAELATDDPNAGGLSDPTCTPLQLDTVAPWVAWINTLPDTGDGVLAECETAQVRLSDVAVSFNEPMRSSAGIPGPDDANNPANYLLVAPGPDLVFDTADCLGGIQGDDVGIPIGGVTYSAPTATLHLPAGHPLGDSLYRLLVCASLLDLGGNALDGDANGTGGDDFVRGFRVDAANLLANGHFDCTLAGWTASPPADVAHDPLADAGGSPHSGAALVTSSEFMVMQCVPVTAGFGYELAGSVRLVATAGPVTVLRSCEFYSAAGCQGTVLATEGGLGVDSITGKWGTFNDEVPAPAGAASARCAFSLEGTNFDALLDRLSLIGPGEIFADGFESGNTSAWSSAVP